MSVDYSSLAKKIAEDISKQIIIGELKPGDKLVEKSYADYYGTSRAPVREAIYLLTTEGLLKRIPRRGAVVKKYTNRDIFDLLIIRNMLENLAVERLDKVELNPLILEEMKNIIQSMHVEDAIFSYTKLNYAFHLCLVKLSGSNPVIETYSRLGAPLLRIQNLSFTQEGNVKKSIEEHKEIYQLLTSGNITDLKILLSSHNDHVISSIQKILTDTDDWSGI